MVDNSVVASVNGTDFYFGVLGLNPRPTNFTTQNDPQASFLQLLKNQSFIPSLSYGYTAGAPYRLNKALGNLILGGYDASAFAATTKTFNFFSDQSIDLTVGLQSVTTNVTGGAETTLGNELISMLIDSSIADIYLPVTVCQAFEKAFGLTWDATTGIYAVSDALHTKLVALNPSVTFTITTPISGGPGVNFTFPYASFDLQASPPFVKQSTRYFPLKQAANNTQYIFGRTFLQEAYLIVDYERSTFSVNPNTWDPNAKAKIVTILPPGTASAAPSLSGGAIAGIVIGVLVFIAAVALAILRFVVRPRRKKAAEELEAAKSPDPAVSELASAFPSTLGSPVSVVKTEAVSEGSRLSELASPAPLSELLSSEIYEMEGTNVPELDGGEPARELDGKDTERSPYMPPLEEHMGELDWQTREMYEQTAEMHEMTAEIHEQGPAEMHERTAERSDQTPEGIEQTAEGIEQTAEGSDQTTERSRQTTGMIEQTEELSKHAAEKDQSATEHGEQSSGIHEPTREPGEQATERSGS